jgi:hypothetical protein
MHSRLFVRIFWAFRLAKNRLCDYSLALHQWLHGSAVIPGPPAGDKGIQMEIGFAYTC